MDGDGDEYQRGWLQMETNFAAMGGELGTGTNIVNDVNAA